jgi:subtilisin family serine protease
VLKTPTTLPPETLEREVESAAGPGVNVTGLGGIGVLLVRAVGGVSTPQLQQTIQQLRVNPNVQEVVQDITVDIDQAQILPSGENRKDADWSPRPGRSGDGIDTVDTDIAILDTGVQSNHPDLTVFRCVGFGYQNCNDGHGHGTHVAGIAAARDNNIGVVGAAPGARIWAIKVLSDQGMGSFSDVLAGINYVFTNRAQIEVVNLSLGAAGIYIKSGLPAENALRILAASGVTVVVSAGNNGQDANRNTPARAGLNLGGVITVSAYGDSDGRCGGYGPATSRGLDDSYPAFSSHSSSYMDLAAAGVDILSTYKNSGYALMSGTSMSAADVAGAAAFYKSLFPAMSPAQVELALKTIGTKMGAYGNGLFPCDGHGRGYVREASTHKEPLLYMGLTGVYNADDGGRYHMRQNGPTTLYWVGQSIERVGGIAREGLRFTNAFIGTEQGLPSTTFSGQWCDVPRGIPAASQARETGNLNCGSLIIRMTSPTTFTRIADGGYLSNFGGSQWTRINDVSQYNQR